MDKNKEPVVELLSSQHMWNTFVNRAEWLRIWIHMSRGTYLPCSVVTEGRAWMGNSGGPEQTYLLYWLCGFCKLGLTSLSFIFSFIKLEED